MDGPKVYNFASWETGASQRLPGAYREAIRSRFEKGLSSERIREDLKVEYGAEVSCDSVNCFVKPLAVNDSASHVAGWR